MTLLRSTRFLSILILVAAPVLPAQQAAPAAPIPAPILSAQRVFLANAGLDAYSQGVFGHLGFQPSAPYDSFYASLKSWGRYQLVAAPAETVLVFTIRTFEQETGGGVGTGQFQTVLTLYDAKTHFPLWTITQPIQTAARAETWRKNIASANENLIGQLKSLLTAAAPATP